MEIPLEIPSLSTVSIWRWQKKTEVALQTAGNQDYQIEVIPDVAHVFVHSPRYLETLEAWLQHLSQ